MFATDSDIHATVDDDLVCLAEFGSIRGKGSDCGVGWSDPLLLCLSFTVYPEECCIFLGTLPTRRERNRTGKKGRKDPHADRP